MFDWVADLWSAFKGYIDGIADAFVSKASEQLEALGIADKWNDLISNSALEQLLTYAPYSHLLIDWDVVVFAFSTSFSLLTSIMIFKIIVKFIPTIY